VSAQIASSRALRRFGVLALSLFAGLAAGLVIASVALYPLGYRPFTVLSGSMSPAIEAGDVVVDSSISPLDAHVGDVVTFPDPQNRSRLITHRLRRVRARGGTVEMVTKGDSNNTSERWSVPAHGRIGRVEYRVPMVGYALAWVSGKHGKLLLIALPAFLLGAYELVRIWRPRPDSKEASGAAAA
jgi:signal peptidase